MKMSKYTALRIARDDAHAVFDLLWLYGTKKQRAQQRGAAYEWLAGAMGLEPEQCHFSKFTLEQCRRATALASNRLEAMKQIRPLLSAIQRPEWGHHWAAEQRHRERKRK